MKNKNKLSTLGKAIEHHQHEKAISTYRLSIISGVEQGAISRIKRGITSPMLYTLERIAKSLGVDLSSIFKTKELIEHELKK